ncbi:hypothetical protein [Bailinhaonella thermotolerans]|uniref:Uncharacterized protein n=1 Tax=Bailinhaonella thermotolerans TaxID=1070861 RepID=A0A3A4A0I9_9ACTN|nr:hypothetical protein [Bailinhaonella thermotolerans]RJL19719.1 hypothetical protein D5H75_40040 [Bailinhaonella thermotolerans]
METNGHPVTEPAPHPAPQAAPHPAGLPRPYIPPPSPATPASAPRRAELMVSDRALYGTHAMAFLRPGDKFKINNSPLRERVLQVVEAAPSAVLPGFVRLLVAEHDEPLTLPAASPVDLVSAPREHTVRCVECGRAETITLDAAEWGTPIKYRCPCPAPAADPHAA